MGLTVGMLKKLIENLDDNMPVRTIEDHGQVAVRASHAGVVILEDDEEYMSEDWWYEADFLTEAEKQEMTKILVIGD